MNQTPESIYFPSLDKCLSKEELLISWKTVFSTLLRQDGFTASNTLLESFFSDKQVQKLLARPFDPFSFTQSNTKSAFDTKTSAVNVTPRSKIDYSIDEIKEDSLWLSKEAQIDEVSALRIVVLEFQSRPTAQIQTTFSTEEAVSLQAAAGNVNSESSNLLASALASAAHGLNAQPQNPKEQRRFRAIQLYLSERQNLLACSRIIFQTGFRQQERRDSGIAEEPSWIERIAESFLSSQEESPERFLHYCITALNSNFQKLDAGSGWFKSEEGRQDIEAEWLLCRITEFIHILETSLVILDYRKEDTRTPANVLEWFKFVAKYAFFENLVHADPVVQALFSSVQSLVAMLSLSMLDCHTMITRIQREDSASKETSGVAGTFVGDVQTIATLHDILWNAGTSLSPIASPAVLAWSLILFQMDAWVKERRELKARAIEDSDEHSRPNSSAEPGMDVGVFFEAIDNIMSGQQKESPIEHLVHCSMEGAGVFNVLSELATVFGSSPASDLRSVLDARIRIIILDVIGASIPLIDYHPVAVSATLAALNGNATTWDTDGSPTQSFREDPVAYFLQNDDLTNTFLANAANRFPHESLPFLKLITAISSCEHWQEDGTPVAMRWLESLSAFTFALPSNFKEYQTIQEEENLNNIELTDDIVLFRPRANLSIMYGRNGGFSTSAQQISDDFTIPAGTPGRIISENDPRVAVWFFDFGGLKYLGKLLETGTTWGEFVNSITGERTPQDELVEIVSILANLIQASVSINEKSGGVGDSQGVAHRILEQASDGLDRDRDIVSVVLSIFEEELERQAGGSAADASLDLLIACVHFLQAVVAVLPGRVWPLIGRCGLLDNEGRTGRLTSILSAIEFVNAKYDFLLSCLHLFSRLVDDAATHAVLRKGGAKLGKESANSSELGTGLPDHILSKAIASFTRTLVMVFESACNWRFSIPEQRLLVSTQISTLFEKIIILHYGVGVGDAPQTGSKLVTALAPAAHHIMDSYLSKTSGLLRFQPIFRGFLDGITTTDTTVQTKSFVLLLDHVSSILTFANTLVKLGTTVDRTGSQLQAQLFRVLPLLARMYAQQDFYRLPVVTILESLVISASATAGEPPSLLGHLGHDTSRNFLTLLMQLGKPTADETLVSSTWNLFSAVVSNRQQWFAIYLLTGKKPRENLKDADADAAAAATPTARPLIRIALDELVKIDSLPLPRALAVLEFVSLSQNYWPWAMKDIANSTDFIMPLSNFVSGFEPVPASASEARMIERAYQARIASYIAEVIAMHLYHERQLGNTSCVAAILPKLKYYERCGVAPPSYNNSLHSNLRKNLEARYPGCNLQDFRRTRLQAKTIGKDYFYDLDLANKMLSFQQAWRGRKGDGMTQELVKANVNLALVDAQISLLHGWKMLAIELSNSIGSSETSSAIATVATDIASDCLVSNTRSQLPETAIFARLNQTRADFALILLQKLSQTKSDALKVKDLLPTTWKVIANLETTFELALEAGPDGAAYYRTLLKILFLVLRFHAANQPTTKQEFRESVRATATPGVASTHLTITLEILDKIIGQGFRDLASAIHAESKCILPDDIALITALLQTCLMMPNLVETRTPQIQAILSTHETARMATALFSWSDKLSIGGDPIYGELSILFLLELSTIPEVAERLAVEGIIGHLSSAPLTVYMRKPNVGPFSDSIGAQRCYSIWARGILPLLLNLLARLEENIAGEIAIFLNQFPNLLQQAETALDMAPERRQGRIRQETRMSLHQISEIQSLAIIMTVLKGCRNRNTHGVPDVDFDSANVLESVETWLNRRQVLQQRIVALGVREAELERRGELEGKIVGELEELKYVLQELGEGN